MIYVSLLGRLLAREQAPELLCRLIDVRAYVRVCLMRLRSLPAVLSECPQCFNALEEIGATPRLTRQDIAFGQQCRHVARERAEPQALRGKEHM